MTTTTNPCPARGFTTRELADELLRRFGPDEACRQMRERVGVSVDTADELRQWADELDGRLA